MTSAFKTEEEAKSAAYSAMVHWASIAEIKKALLTPCECDSSRTGTVLRGPRSCFNCYVRELAARSFSEIDQKDVQKLAVEMVKRFHEGNLEDALQEKLDLN